MLYKSSLKNKKRIQKENLRHIAIIMDGNGRWAEKRGKIRTLGHKEGFKTARKIIKYAVENNIKILTLYVFSRENWRRPKLEITALMKLFFFALKSEIKNLNKYNIRLKIIGDTSPFNENLKNYIHKVEKQTFNNTGLILNIAANYSGRWDIIRGIKKIIKDVQKDVLDIDQIQERNFSQYLSTSELLPVDLVIRTGGEKRISNFLLWQIAYSELYFTDILWPDFNWRDFQHAIDYFFTRERRFGGISIS
ncbi:polyprenyl diphosphate synthase [Buchnera aphidicola]|jgi:undecaprenyl diphosphate synthase|uniref:Ditrans,polycis-undecaprenyl-diphosphate synthase ((2E,6E)-farnesyl-diphosphate specific) n=1 Tax=Buchnera aphidicola subsp. Schizaphis graminum (strain Sg) TaxID=198804 RepID=UPPS_BUCAP|nr:polyprenyl diphosphate synthase [Buchnera aphidicola]Q8K9S6.1 RecName: Full=Ditrans,polycis-undecaprenyl-diphosphate synthase ((2E,6E)-farnesyl-diphosphate specific); AltName: Full=Ditrans,polycis-undecaprenylcistransferase; AltName: Full=Undecaprenyl diphosphate synthase; Short=UDS; AltName: Full=Undecaprenyl pyrophosphate synthase; Short=UPP synthase [Buchnera aphidicola str. Sg (Schizaphis graminum)]AAM67789.1 undecaprenyl pyrophosphate synthetase [Buchnera aphidicola str. Sg (Schizaphis gr